MKFASINACSSSSSKYSGKQKLPLQRHDNLILLRTNIKWPYQIFRIVDNDRYTYPHRHLQASTPVAVLSLLVYSWFQYEQKDMQKDVLYLFLRLFQSNRSIRSRESLFEATGIMIKTMESLPQINSIRQSNLNKSTPVFAHLFSVCSIAWWIIQTFLALESFVRIKKPIKYYEKYTTNLVTMRFN